MPAEVTIIMRVAHLPDEQELCELLEDEYDADVIEYETEEV
jgi:hypothetical protein